MMDKSKLPVPRHQTQNTELSVPFAKMACPQRPVLPLFSKEPNISFASAVPAFGIFKDGSTGKEAKKMDILRKKPVTSKKSMPLARGPFVRSSVESELKDKNKLLEAANSSLHSKLLSTQNTIKESSIKQDALDKENQELKKRLESSMIILESHNIDPVSGEQILAQEEERNKLREERKAVTEDLIRELEQFAVNTKEQTALVQTINKKWRGIEEGRREFLEEQKAFEKDLEQFRAALDEAEKWLDV